MFLCASNVLYRLYVYPIDYETMIDFLKSHYKHHFKHLSKFTIVGGVNTVIDFTLFFLLFNVFGLHYALAHVGAFFIAWINSFVFNALWTFQNLKRDQLFKQVFVFLIVGLVGLALSTMTIFLVGYLADIYAGGSVWWVYGAKILAMFVSFSWNYIGSSLFVFNK